MGYFLQCADKEVDVGKYWFGITCEKGEKVNFPQPKHHALVRTARTLKRC